jgi:pimeloyl-ACP methyl ester carboxylesterase
VRIWGVSTEFPHDGWPATKVPLPGEVTLNVRESPAGPGAEPAVLVHGLGGSSLNWTALMGLMGDRLASRAPDLPGFGLSPPPHDGRYTVAAHAAAVEALIDKDGRGPVHLFGNSLGGAIATTVAAERPDLVRTLTLVSPALPDLAPGLYRLPVAVTGIPGVGSALAGRLAKLPPDRRVRQLVHLCFADPSAVSAEWVAAAEREVAARQRQPYAVDAMARSAHGIVREFLARGPEGLWERAARVPAPTLVLYGRADKLVRPAMAPKARRTFPDARVYVLPHTGHVAQMEHPGLVARLVREHLDRAAATA